MLTGNCSTCFGWYRHPSSGTQTTVSKASGICHTVTAIWRYRGRVGTGLSVLWVAYATHSTLKPLLWLSHRRGRQPKTYVKPEAAITVLSSWWWAVWSPKHVEQLRNTGIINSTTRLHLTGSLYEIRDPLCTVSVTTTWGTAIWTNKRVFQS
jgi:hypothetical protein